MKYNKLIRDKIPEYIKSKGGAAIYHKASEEEYWQKLKEKLQEEVVEFLEAESVEELADVSEVIDAIMVYKQISEEDLQDSKSKKVEARGGFKDRLILDES